MSQQNIELVRRANEAFNRREAKAMLELCADDVEVEDLHNAPDMPRVVVGAGQVLKLMAAWIDAFDDFDAEIEEYVEIDDWHVACIVRYRGTQRDEGLTVDARGVDVWEVRDQKLARGTIGYANLEAAREAVAARNRAETN